MSLHASILPSLLAPALCRAQSAPATCIEAVKSKVGEENISLELKMPSSPIGSCKPQMKAVRWSANATQCEARNYLVDLVFRCSSNAQERALHRQRVAAACKLQRATTGFLGKLRHRRKIQGVVLVQKWTRGFLQRLKLPSHGKNILIERRKEYAHKKDLGTKRFVQQSRNLPDQRATLVGLSKLVQKSDRAKCLDRLLELEHERSQLVGLQVLKDFLRNLRLDLLSRVTFGEDVQIKPLLLFGPPGSGKRLSANMLYSELSAMQICTGPFIETQTWKELQEAWKTDKDGMFTHCIYITDMEERCATDWDEVLKMTLKAAPKAFLIFGLNCDATMKKIQGWFTKVEPVRLLLPALTASELAQITRHSLESCGYVLSGGLMTEMLTNVISEQWTYAEIASRNGHLVKIMMERAVQNRNIRQPLRFGSKFNPALLLPEDFGITELGKLELKQAQVKVVQELSDMPGFERAKEFMRGVQRRVEFVASGGNPALLDTCMNIVLTGNPGAGKTTFARLLFRCLRAHGVLKRDVFVELNALELKGEYLGHTAPKVKDAIHSARGGALFLDEAYALCSTDGGRKDSFSGEAVHTLLTEIENNRTEVLVILAGYDDKMGHFMAQDPGLARRFPLRLNLPDYTSGELAQIAEKVAQERFSLSMEVGLLARLQRYIEEEHRNEIRNQNASLAVSLVEQAVERMTCRIMESNEVPQEGSNSELLAVDFGIKSMPDDEQQGLQEKQQIQEELDALVGMEQPKKHLCQLKRKIDFVRMGGSPKILDTCMNLVLTGNPGTGKTTFARLLFRFLRAHGVLKKDVFIERNALELKGEYCGQTAPKIREIFEMAMGGCLFLDEAYALANGDKFSNEAIRMLLTEVENHRTEVLVVLAGYEDKMAELMRADPGLARRFPHSLKLPDYSAADIARIASGFAGTHMEVPFADGLEETLAAWLEPNMARLDASKHNGGLAVKLTEAALGRLAHRVTSDPAQLEPQSVVLSAQDFDLE